MVIICPYCDIEISEKLVEAEDGCCPECGTSITARNVIEEPEEDIYAKEFEDDVDDDGYEPDFEDEFDMEDDDLLADPDEDVEFQKPRRISKEWEEMQDTSEDALAIAAGVKTASSAKKETAEDLDLEDTAASATKSKTKKSGAKSDKKAAPKKEETKKAAKSCKAKKK